MGYNKSYFAKRTTEQIEKAIAELDKRAKAQFKLMQKNGAHHVAINYANTKSTLSGHQEALADRLAGLV